VSDAAGDAGVGRTPLRCCCGWRGAGVVRRGAGGATVAGSRRLVSDWSVAALAPENNPKTKTIDFKTIAPKLGKRNGTPTDSPETETEGTSSSSVGSSSSSSSST